MPVAGFLGFPPFALQCVAIVAGLEALGGRLKERSPATRRLVVVVATGVAIAGTAVVFRAGEDVTTDSRFAPVGRLEVLPAEDRRALAEAGLHAPERLCRALDDEAGLAEWSSRSGIGVDRLREHRERVALVLHQGLGDARARELAGLGIRTRRDLARWSPPRLAAALRGAGARGPHRFLERRATVWLDRLPSD
jgi:hypothetical protein